MKSKAIHPKSLRFLVLPFFLLLSHSLIGQLPDLISTANGQLDPIETDKEIISQEINSDEERPYNIEFVRAVEKVKDGKVKRETYVVNLALLNSKKVVIKSSKSQQLLKMETKGGKYIQRYEDGEPKGFTNVMEVQFKDIDGVREAQSIWEEIIERSISQWEEDISLPNTVADMKVWLQKYVVSVSMDKHDAFQSLSPHDQYEDYLTYEVSNLKNKDRQALYTFSLADIEGNSLKASPSGSVMKLDIKSKGNKKYFIQEDQNGLSFSNNISLYFEDAASALECAKGIEAGIDLSKVIAEERNNQYEVCNDCLSEFMSAINEYNNNNISTELTADCISELNISKDDKSEYYRFRWADINADRVQQQFGTKEMKLILETQDKSDYILKTADGEIKGYQDKLELYFNDLETFRKATKQVVKIIGNCELGLEPKSAEWIQELFSSNVMNGIEQSLDLADDCSWEVSLSKEDGNKTDNYEFNIYDIDPNRMNLKVSKSKLQLELNTNRKEKIITKTNDEGKLEYTNKITLNFDSLDHLRIGAMTIHQLIGSCNPD